MILYACSGGEIVLPATDLVLVDRADGGNLVVNPPRPVWERSELHPDELVAWSFLVAATGKAMLATLPQLHLGCLNYWEAGNWALHPDAEPIGPKTAPGHRQVHLHLLGRSREAASPDLAWGEAPSFPSFVGRHAWAARHRRLNADECAATVVRAVETLREVYALDVPDARLCEHCAHPRTEDHDCPERGAG